MFTVYVIYSKKLDRYYVGYCEDFETRLIQHNSGVSTFTAKATDWQLVYQEKFETRKEGAAREREIKKKKSRKYIEWLVAGKP
jgi:putative endonuclease